MKAITTREDAIKFIQGCILFIGPGFHPDTPMGGYVTGNDFPLLNTGAAIHYTHLLADCHDMLGEDIYQVGLELMQKLGYAPTANENGEKQPDWQKEVDSVWKKRDIAVKWIEDAIPAGSTMRMESTINRLDSIRHTAGGLVLVNGPHGGITMPFWKLNALDVLRAAASVQKAIEGGKQS